MSKQLALVIDLNVCVGCHACVTSCKQWNASGEAGFLSDDNPCARDPTGTFFNRVQTFEVGEFRNTQAAHFPRSSLMPEWGTHPANHYLLRRKTEITLHRDELERVDNPLKIDGKLPKPDVRALSIDDSTTC